MSKDPHYISNLLEKYRNHSISVQERHELEKLALDDPFLFDAMEGLSHHGNVIKPINRNLEGLKKRFFSWQSYGAAAVLLITTLFLLKDSFIPSSSSIVQLEEKNTEIQDKLEEGERSNEDMVISDSPIVGNQQEERLPTNTSSKERTTVQGVITDKSSGKPIVGAKINSDKGIESNIVTTDNDGRFQMEVPIEKEVIADADGYERQIVEVNDIDGANIRLESDNKVISSSSRAKMKESIEPSKKVVEDAAVYPNMGVTNLELYIQRNKEVPLEAFRKNFRGEVEVKFTVKKDGTLADFKIEETECPSCGEEVIRLLKKSGKWTTVPKNIEKETAIKVKF